MYLSKWVHLERRRNSNSTVGKSDQDDQDCTPKSNIYGEYLDSVSVWISLPNSPVLKITTLPTVILVWCNWCAFNGNQAKACFDSCVSEVNESVTGQHELNGTQCTARRD